MELDEIRTPIKEVTAGNNEETRIELGEGAVQQSNLLIHPHGLSSKKKIATYHQKHRDNTNESANNYLEFDTSIDLGRSETRNDHSSKKVLENMDVNRMFNVGTVETDLDMSSAKENVDTTQPVARIELSSPAKLETEEGEPSLKKLRLESQAIPRLENPESISLTKSDSPITNIQMEETKSSPMKLEGNSSDLNRNNTSIGIINSIKTAIEDIEKEPSSPMTPAATQIEDDNNNNNIFTNDASIHKLSPIYPRSQIKGTAHKDVSDIQEVEKEHENFKQVLKRNEELIQEVNVVNLKLNEYMYKLESAEYRYNKLHISQDATRKEFEERLDKVNNELQNLSEEKNDLIEKRSKLKEKLLGTKDEIQMLNQNQKILQDKYDETIASLENATEEYHKIEHDRDSLKSSLDAINKEKEELEKELLTSKTQLNQTEDWNSQLQEEKSKLDGQVLELEKELDTKKETIEALETKLNDALENQKSTNDEMLAKVEELQETKLKLEKNLTDLKNEYDNYKSEVVTNNEQLQSNLDEALAKVANYEKELEQVNTQLKSVQSEYATLKRSYIDVDDDAKIRNAEVTELNRKQVELEEAKGTLEKNLEIKESEIVSLKEQLEEKQNSYNKVSLELESLCLKSNNIEKEHLAELESLHDSLSQLQTELKNKSDTLNELKDQFDSLKDENTKLQLSKENAAIEESTEKQDNELNSAVIQELNIKVANLEEKLTQQEQEKNRQLQQLSDDLYVQYSSKHEQKVKMLKKNYEATYKKNVEEITIQNKSYVQEIKQLTSQLEYERKEKQELLKLLEQK